ncbi:MAG: hypothetical protein ABR566_17965, partial [Pyrinomonadaceae bacterium]
TTTNAAGGGLITGGFQLFDVNVLSPAVPAGTLGSTIGTVNLPARTVGVNIVAGGGIAGQLSLLLTNRAAITGFIEICKQAATIGGADVTGTFSFTIEGVFNANGVGLQVFTAPVGQCTGPISVLIGTPGTPQEGGTLGGPVALIGIDPEDTQGCTVDHDPNTQFAGIVTAINAAVRNGGTGGILVIGGGKQLTGVNCPANSTTPGDDATAFWRDISTATGLPVT